MSEQAKPEGGKRTYIVSYRDDAIREFGSLAEAEEFTKLSTGAMPGNERIVSEIKVGYEWLTKTVTELVRKEY